MKKPFTTSQFISMCEAVHDNFYDYSKTHYKFSKEKIIIICPNHGEFNQVANVHKRGGGCPHCAGNVKLSTSDFIKRANDIHENFYSYVNLNKVSHSTKIEIVCPFHGNFKQTVNDHLSGKGCKECANIKIGLKKRKPISEFIEISTLKHNGRYNYDKVFYNLLSEKITITCIEHGDFEQVAAYHITGRTACSGCLKKSKSVIDIENFLIENGISYIREFKFDDCIYKNHLPFDFYLPEINTCVEYDGEQHFMAKSHWGGEEEFNQIKLRDSIKTDYCKSNNINLIRISYTENHIEILKTILRR